MSACTTRQRRIKRHVALPGIFLLAAFASPHSTADTTSVERCQHAVATSGHTTPMDDQSHVARLEKISAALQRELEIVESRLARGKQTTSSRLAVCRDRLEVRLLELADARRTASAARRSDTLTDAALRALSANTTLALRDHQTVARLVLVTSGSAVAHTHDDLALKLAVTVTDDRLCLTREAPLTGLEQCWQFTRTGRDFMMSATDAAPIAATLP